MYYITVLMNISTFFIKIPLTLAEYGGTILMVMFSNEACARLPPDSQGFFLVPVLGNKYLYVWHWRDIRMKVERRLHTAARHALRSWRLSRIQFTSPFL